MRKFNLLIILIFVSACSGGGGGSSGSASLCSYIPVEGASTALTNILSGETLSVSCEDGYYGGGPWHCQSNGTFYGNKCEKESFTASAYAAQNFHCDLNEDGIVDEGEDIDFPDHSFVTKWRVPGDSLSIELPVINSERLEFFVDWGDGKCSKINSENFDQRIHTYESADDYQVRIIGNVLSWGGENSSSNYRSKLIEVLELGDVAWENLKNAFSDLPNLVSFKSIFSNTSNVTNMEGMFKDSSAITFMNLEGLTTQLVENMSHMFSGLTEITELDLSHLVTPKLNDIEGMFKGMSKLETLDISNFITENVLDMAEVFYGATSLTNIRFGDYFETKNVTNMESMFRGVKLSSLDLSFFDTSKVENMSYMFEGTSDLTNIIFGDTFKTANVTNMKAMFSGCGASSLDLRGFDTSKVTDMSEMFKGTSNVTNIFFGDYFVTKDVINMYYMFGDSAVSSLDLRSWDTGKVTNMSQMFYNTRNVTNIFMGNRFVTTNVINMFQMFDGSSVSELDLQYFDNQNVESIYGMFNNTTNLTNLVMGDSFVTSNVTNLGDMFNDSAVTSLDLSTWDTSSVTDMSGMFQDTDTLTNIVLGGSFSSSNVEDFSNFLNGSGVSGLDFADLNTSSAADMSNMLSNMTDQEAFDLSSFDTSNVTSMESMLENLGNVTDIDISGWDTSSVSNFSNILGTTTLDRATSINLGSLANSTVIPVGYDMSGGPTVQRVCVGDIDLIDSSSPSYATYFSGTTMSLPSTSGAVDIVCDGGKFDVKVSCNSETGQIDNAGGSDNISTCF